MRSVFFISVCLFVLGNDLIRGFLVQHGAVIEWFYVESKHSGLHHGAPLQITQRKSPWSSGGGKKTLIAAQSPSPFFSFYPQFFPSCKIIHFNSPTPFPLSHPLKLVIKRLTSLHTKRDVFEMQTHKHLGLKRFNILFHELWRHLVPIDFMQHVNAKGFRQWLLYSPVCCFILTIHQCNDEVCYRLSAKRTAWLALIEVSFTPAGLIKVR